MPTPLTCLPCHPRREPFGRRRDPRGGYLRRGESDVPERRTAHDPGRHQRV